MTFKFASCDILPIELNKFIGNIMFDLGAQETHWDSDQEITRFSASTQIKVCHPTATPTVQRPEIKSFFLGGLTHGETNAIIKNFMKLTMMDGKPVEMVEAINSGKIELRWKPNRFHFEKGVANFSFVGRDHTGANWIELLRQQGYEIDPIIEEILASDALVKNVRTGQVVKVRMEQRFVDIEETDNVDAPSLDAMLHLRYAIPVSYFQEQRIHAITAFGNPIIIDGEKHYVVIRCRNYRDAGSITLENHRKVTRSKHNAVVTML